MMPTRGAMSAIFKMAVGATLATTASGAGAAWQKASSTHFVIYGDVKPNQIRDYATRLERFDQAVRFALQLSDPPVGDGNRVTVFLMPNEASIQQLSGNKNIAGYYQPQVTGPLAFVPSRISMDDSGSFVDIIFFHEYAHHLTMEDLDRPYPQWLVEGLAEFLSTAHFEKNGTVVLGGADNQRAYALFHGQGVSLETLMAGDYSKLSKQQVEDSVYGEGWLVTHFLLSEPGRLKQLNAYLDALARGAKPLEAAQAFGDLKQLQHDLNAYLERIQKVITVMEVPPAHAQPGKIDVVPLSEGASAMMPLRIKLKAQTKAESPDALAADIRAVEARYPGDELVETTLAGAELGTQHADAAEAAADRALKANARSVEALTLKGKAIVEKARAAADSASRKTQFDQARNLFIAANKLDTENPDPLFEYYRSYLEQRIRPTDDAIAGMHYASDLIPQDFGLRMNSALAYLNERKLKEARSTLAPVAYSPHAGSIGEIARRMIADIEAGNGTAAIKETGSGSAQTQAR